MVESRGGRAKARKRGGPLTEGLKSDTFRIVPRGVIRRTPLKRSSVRLKRTPLRRIGKRGRKKMLAKRKVREDFFAGEPSSYCQICGGFLLPEQADACHKLDASLGGPETPENLLVGHGFRSGPTNCNAWMELSHKFKVEARESPVNARTGGIVQWTEETLIHLREFLRKGGVPWARLPPFV